MATPGLMTQRRKGEVPNAVNDERCSGAVALPRGAAIVKADPAARSSVGEEENHRNEREGSC